MKTVAMEPPKMTIEEMAEILCKIAAKTGWVDAAQKTHPNIGNVRYLVRNYGHHFPDKMQKDLWCELQCEYNEGYMKWSHEKGLHQGTETLPAVIEGAEREIRNLVALLPIRKYEPLTPSQKFNSLLERASYYENKANEERKNGNATLAGFFEQISEKFLADAMNLENQMKGDASAN